MPAKESPCPFCNELSALVTKFEVEPHVAPLFAVVCTNCESQGPKEDSAADALVSWADRAPAELDESQVLQLLEGLLRDGVRKRLGL